jgi:hypothetical protein
VPQRLGIRISSACWRTECPPPESAPTSNLNDPAPYWAGPDRVGLWPVGTPVNCDACHNNVTQNLTEVTPRPLKATGLGREARCMVCHQGRESTVSVEKRSGCVRRDHDHERRHSQ